MASNSSDGTYLLAAGVVSIGGDKDALCDAYKNAVNDWCADGKGNRKGNFNDYVDDQLQAKGILLAREVPIGAVVKRGAAHSFEALSKHANPKIADAAMEYLKLMGPGGAGLAAVAVLAGGTIGFDMFRFLAAKEIRSIFGGFTLLRNRSGVLFPDFNAPDGTPIEVKRPAEPESHQDQHKDYAKCSPNGKCINLDCDGCGLDCSSWKSDCEGAPMA